MGTLSEYHNEEDKVISHKDSLSLDLQHHPWLSQVALLFIYAQTRWPKGPREIIK
jgi:hypothetical protein